MRAAGIRPAHEAPAEGGAANAPHPPTGKPRPAKSNAELDPRARRPPKLPRNIRAQALARPANRGRHKTAAEQG
jgi:hypothetical protein